MVDNHPVLGVIMNLVCLTGILGNLTTIFLIPKRKTFTNIQNAHIFLRNLAIVDLMASIFSVTIGAKFIDFDIMQNKLAYYVYVLLDWLIRPLALLSLTLFTLNRFYIVRKQNTWKVFSKQRSWWYVCAIWCLSISVMVIGIWLISGTSATQSCNPLCKLTLK